MEKLLKFLRDEEGVTAIEYALIAAGIAVAIALVVFAVGDRLWAVFDVIRNQIGAPPVPKP